MKKILIAITLVLVTMLSGCYNSNQKLAKKMIEKYSNNQNYVSLSGEVIESDGNYLTIRCEELSDYINYEDEFCSFYIYSDKIINLHAGDRIDFVTVPFHFYNGHKLPIVELKLGGNTLLTFEEGKEYLISWVNTEFG